MNISIRTAATWRKRKFIPYHKIEGIIFYLKSDVLDMLKKNRIESIGNKVRRLYIMPNKWGGYETILKNDKNECVYDESIGYPYPEMGFFDTIEELEGEILRLYNK